jgi:hypothetical protein
MEGKVASVYAMRLYGGVELHSFLTLSLDGGELVRFVPWPLDPGEVSTLPILLEAGCTPEAV